MTFLTAFWSSLLAKPSLSHTATRTDFSVAVLTSRVLTTSLVTHATTAGSFGSGCVGRVTGE